VKIDSIGQKCLHSLMKLSSVITTEVEYNFVNLQALNPEQLLFFQKYFMFKYPKYEGSWKSENIPDVFST
jgi:hypothetical protein